MEAQQHINHRPTSLGQKILTTNVIVKVGDNVLRSGWYKQFKVQS